MLVSRIDYRVRTITQVIDIGVASLTTYKRVVALAAIQHIAIVQRIGALQSVRPSGAVLPQTNLLEQGCCSKRSAIGKFDLLNRQVVRRANLDRVAISKIQQQRFRNAVIADKNIGCGNARAQQQGIGFPAIAAVYKNIRTVPALITVGIAACSANQDVRSLATDQCVATTKSFDHVTQIVRVYGVVAIRAVGTIANAGIGQQLKKAKAVCGVADGVVE